MTKITLLSIIIPVLNEEENIIPLYSKINKSLTGLNFEVIFIDDGSIDNTEGILKKINKKDKRFHYIVFEKNFGKNSAIEAGVKFAKGKIIVSLDGDLQHDPAEIKNFIQKIDQGYDLVIGWRKERLDPWPRIFFSKIVNFFVRALTGFQSHDFYCGFKCYKKEVAKKLGLYGDFFRFIAFLAYKSGFRVGEVEVTYHYRQFGKSKYGFGLIKRAIYDLLIIIFVIRKLQKEEYKIKNICF